MWAENTQSAELRVHPSSSSDAVRKLSVQLRADRDGILSFRYSLDADMARIRVPGGAASDRADGLWKHTCFEAFVAPAHAPGYYEFNFSPSLAWAVYRFGGYREGMTPAELVPVPEICVCRSDEGLELHTAVHLEQLADLREAHHLRIALAGVIEDEHDTLSYWALRHPSGRPDFHHAIGFTLEVDRS